MKPCVSQSPVQSDTGQQLYPSWARCPTPRLPNHRLHLEDARAFEPHAGSPAMRRAKLLDLGIVRGQQTCDGLWSVNFLAGVGVGRLRRLDDVEEALAAAVVAAAWEGQGTCGQCTRWRASCSTCSGRLPVIMQ